MNKVKKIIYAATVFLPIYAYAQVDQDRESIKQMAGCYQIEFAFDETQPLKEGYQIHKPYRETALEWISLEDRDSPNELSLQHVLWTPMGFIKHWRQDWKYQDNRVYVFKGDGVWMPRELNRNDTEGRWTQEVYEVDDTLRYECNAAWIHRDNEHYWECETPSPLPRRELARKHEYNVLVRDNRQQIWAQGWQHVQKNTKTKVTNEVSEAIVIEEGLNKYTRVDDSRCEEAAKWWEGRRNIWSHVRRIWDEHYGRREPIYLMDVVDGQKLHMRIFDLVDEAKAEADYNSGKFREKVQSAIDMYLNVDKKNRKADL